MGKTEVPTVKRTPTLRLSEKEGSKVIAILKKRLEGQGRMAGKFSSLLEVLETDGSTTIKNKETKVRDEVKIQKGDLVFLPDTKQLLVAFSAIPIESKVEVTFTGFGEEVAGQHPEQNYKVEVYDTDEVA